MGGCALPDCNNTFGEKRLFTFPRDETRRKLWISRCYLTSVSRSARLCEAHFDDSQFELNRQDGWKRLKLDAVPTLFPEPIITLKIKTGNGEPDTIMKVFEGKSRKRKTRKLDNDNESSKKESLKKRKSGRLVSGPKSKKHSLVDNLDQFQGIKKKLKDKAKLDKVATNSKIVKNVQPNAEESDTSNGPLIPILKIKMEPEDLTESDEHTDNTTNVQNAKTNTGKLDKKGDPQLLALMRQWNVVLREELEELRQKEKAEKLKNDILLYETLRINQKIEELKCEVEAVNHDKNELDKQNRTLKRVLYEKQHDNKQFELEKEAFEDAGRRLQGTNKVIMSENENMKLDKYDIIQEHKKFMDAVNENNNLKYENNLLQHGMKSYKKNNQDMFKSISELRKQNKALGQKLMEFRNGKIVDATTLKHEKELLQIQVKELKSQHQTIIIENECMLEEIKEFIISNEGMHKAITELEKHNSAINSKLKDLEEKNQSLSKKILDLESEINDLTKDGSSKVH